MKFYLTTPIYYINDKPHIGTAYTTIVADVIARYYRQKLGPDNVRFLTGTDEHGAKIEKRAQAAGQDPQAFANEVAATFRRTWEELNISFDDFIRTTEPRHVKVAEELFAQLKNATTPKGNTALYEGQYEGLYCVGHEAFMKESELVDGLCPDHKTKPEQITEKNWFFKLSDFEKELKYKIETKAFLIEPESRRNEILGFLKQGLEDVAFSRPSVKWGIPVPFDAGQTIYVWVEALMNYISALGEPQDDLYKRFWPADVHLVGKDIIKFHCVIWPAMLMALDLPLPKQVFAHGFFTINGQKMSKSLGNAIDPLAMKAKYGNDALRYFLLREIPFGNDGDFSEMKLGERYVSDLANGLGNLVSRVTNMLEKFGDGRYVRSKTLNNGQTGRWISAMEEFRFHDALAVAWEHIESANQLIDEKEPWKMAKDGQGAELDELLNDLANRVLNINVLIAPVMPETAAKIGQLFEQPVKKAEPLFPRIQ